MVVSRNSARRRRLVVDPTTQLGDAVVESNTKSAPPRRQKSVSTDARTYSYGADRRNQRKTTDLIPKRAVSYLFVVLLLLAGLWLINFTAQHADHWAEHIGEAGITAFSLQGQGSLGSWFASFLLIMTGLASLQIYALRQHRCDDYRGTYRLWLWTAGLLILASIHCVTDLGTVASNLFDSFVGGSLARQAWIPIAIKIGALTVLIGRGLYEVRESRGSFALVVFVWVAYSAAAIMQLPSVEQNMVGVGPETVIGNCVLFATASLFLAHLTYARYTFLHAHGLIAPRVRREKTTKVKKTATKVKRTESKKRRTSDSASEESKTAAAKPKKRKSTKARTTSDKADDAGDLKPVAKTKKSRKSNSSSSAATPERKQETQTPDPKSNNSKTPSDVLRELAAASRAKEQAKRTSTETDEADYEGVIQLSKSQRRKKRKLDKQIRRAA